MKKRLLVVASLLLAFSLSACGGKKDENYTKKGLEAVVSQNYSSALNYFDKALLEGENQEEIHRGIGLTYMGLGEYGKALSSFHTALSYADMSPSDLEYDINYYMAICYYKLGEYDKAISVYDSIIALLPKDKEAYYLRGSMKLYMDDVEAAMKDFDKVVSLNKKDYSTYIDVYQVMLEHGYGDAANKYLDVVMSADVGDISSYDMGRLCYFQGEYAQACAYLEKARENNRNSAKLISLLGECYKLDGRYDFAAVVYSSYVEEYKNPEIYNKLGLCYVEQGDYQSAINSFQKGIEIESNNTCMQALKLNEIACYEYLHDYAMAKEKLDEYMASYPSNPTLEKEYKFLTTR